MRKNFSLAGKANFKDPRVSMRAVLGVLLLANVAAALVLIKPFGGSADDLRRQQASLAAQLSAAQYFQYSRFCSSWRPHVLRTGLPSSFFPRRRLR